MIRYRLLAVIDDEEHYVASSKYFDKLFEIANDKVDELCNEYGVQEVLFRIVHWNDVAMIDDIDDEWVAEPYEE